MVFELPLLEWIDIPAGKVTLESGETFDVQPFKIARYPVTNAQFADFVEDNGYKNSAWWEGLAQTGGSPRPSDWKEADSPKLQVCWYEAAGFCRWLSDKTGLDIRLPTEWEWQWAAVGDSGWDYPYGDTFDPTKCSTKETGIGRANPVTQYADVSTHFGVVDMAGNVWEWCLNEGDDPYNTQLSGETNRVMKGGSWNNAQANARAAFRSSRSPRTRTFNIGFRVIAAS
jgi:formylglycine-generating enzyme required for sulfatase activity